MTLFTPFTTAAILVYGDVNTIGDGHAHTDTQCIE